MSSAVANPFRALLGAHEWYDNHKITQILTCRRKAFWHYHWGPAREGLADKVGPGANFGFAIHAALARYYKDWTTDAALETARRAAAFRAFATAYERSFPEGTPVETKHTLERGLRILDDYFNYFEQEDRLFRPVEPEIGGIVRIVPEPGDPPDFTEPFLFVWRADGIFERVSTGEWLILETKTTGSGVDRELTRFEMRRQVRGYQWCANQFNPAKPIIGILANVLLVAAAKTEFKRDFFTHSAEDLRRWRRQTVHIVQDWRTAVGRAAFAPLDEQLDIFYQTTDACTNYGLCPFYKLCKHGPYYGLSEMEPNRWIPLE